MNNYIIVYNYTQAHDTKAIHDYIITMPSVNDWWHYIPNAYVVSSNSTSYQLTTPISTKFPGLLFFVTQVNLGDSNGVLIRKAWDWIQNKVNKVFKLKVKPLPPIKTGDRPAPVSMEQMLANTIVNRQGPSNLSNLFRNTPRQSGSNVFDAILRSATRGSNK